MELQLQILIEVLNMKHSLVEKKDFKEGLFVLLKGAIYRF